jgi:excisionase family DNA binding protein
MSSWLTYHEAAELLGTHVSNVAKLVAKAELTSRGGRRGSLSRAEVEALGERRRSRKAELAARGPRRYQRVDHRPDQKHDWVGPREVAARLGVSTVTVRRRIDLETLPGTVHEGYYWVRREHLELIEKAQHGPEVLRSGGPLPG